MADEKKDEKVKEPQEPVASPKMHDKEQVAPDGHVNLSKEDIANRA